MQLLRLISNNQYCFINLDKVIKIEATYKGVELLTIHTSDGKQTMVQEHIEDVFEQIKIFLADKGQQESFLARVDHLPVRVWEEEID